MYLEIETEGGTRTIVSLDSAIIEPDEGFMESNENKTLITIPEGYVRVAEPYEALRRRINEAGLLIGLPPKEPEQQDTPRNPEGTCPSCHRARGPLYCGDCGREKR